MSPQSSHLSEWSLDIPSARPATGGGVGGEVFAVSCLLGLGIDYVCASAVPLPASAPCPRWQKESDLPSVPGAIRSVVVLVHFDFCHSDEAARNKALFLCMG